MFGHCLHKNCRLENRLYATVKTFCLLHKASYTSGLPRPLDCGGKLGVGVGESIASHPQAQRLSDELERDQEWLSTSEQAVLRFYSQTAGAMVKAQGPFRRMRRFVQLSLAIPNLIIQLGAKIAIGCGEARPKSFARAA